MESTSQQSPCVVYDQSKADDVAGTSIISYAAVADRCIDAEVKTVIMVVDIFIMLNIVTREQSVAKLLRSSLY